MISLRYSIIIMLFFILHLIYFFLKFCINQFSLQMLSFSSLFFLFFFFYFISQNIFFFFFLSIFTHFFFFLSFHNRNDDVSVLTGYKSPGIGTHKQTGVLSSSSSAHQIGGTSTSRTQHTNSSTYAKLGTGTLSGIGNGRKMSSPVTSTSTLPEWNNCSDICVDVALDNPSRTSPRSKSKIELIFNISLDQIILYFILFFCFCLFLLHFKLIFLLSLCNIIFVCILFPP